MRSWLKAHFKTHIILLAGIVFGLVSLCPQSLALQGEEIALSQEMLDSHQAHPKKIDLTHCCDVTDCSGALLSEDSVKPKAALIASHLDSKLSLHWVGDQMFAHYCVGRSDSEATRRSCETTFLERP